MNLNQNGPEPAIGNAPKWIGWSITLALLILWCLGVRDAIIRAHNPGFVRRSIPHPYPTGAVCIVCTLITIECVALYGILRPFSFNEHRRRVFLALLFFLPLWVVDFIFISGATDGPGYYYANAFFLLLTNAFLTTVGLIVFIGSRAF